MDSTVEEINRGSRSKTRKDRTVYKNKEYKDNDPLAMNFHQECRHKSTKTFHCSNLTIENIIDNRKRFFKSSQKVQQDIYLTRLIAPYEPQRRTIKSSPAKKNRKASCTYFIIKKQKRVQVCKTFFMKTFSIGQKRLQNLIITVLNGGIPSERRGGDRVSKKSEAKKQSLRLFLNKLPASESHYSRNKSKRIYLSSELNVKKLLKFYNNAVDEQLKVSRTMFYSVFLKEYNIGFKQPATDVCSTCILWTNKIKNERDPQKKSLLMIEKRVHKLRANCFYELMRKDDQNSLSFCFDLQKVQVLPKTPIQDAFYARQISLYNFCVVDVQGKTPTFYSWLELQSGRGAVEIGSAIYTFLCNLVIPDNVTTLRLFCDGCGGQNKNSHLIHILMYWLVNSQSNLQYIHLFFPVRGHSFLPADRVFGRLEKDIRQRPIIINKEEYYEIFSRHGKLKILGEDWVLYDIKSLGAHYKKLTAIQSLKRIQLKKINNSGRLDCKVKSMENYRFEASEKFISLCKRGKRHPLSIDQIQDCHYQLNANKKKDVINLLVKQFGDNWSELSELEWYRNILLNDSEGSEINEDHQHQQQCDDDESCQCLEMDIGQVRI